MILFPRLWPLVAAALVALGLFVVHDARPAAAEHGTATTVWSATLTVKDLGGARYGCDNTKGGYECSSALTGDDFIYDGADYEVTAVSLRQGTLIVTLDTGIPAAMSVLTLSVDNVDLALEDNTSALLNSARWLRSGIDWEEGDTVDLSLAKLPSPTGVTLSTEALTITEGDSGTFAVALTDDPGSSLTVTLVKAPYVTDPVTGAIRYGFDRNAATVNPATLTFTAGSSGNYDTPQAVTVTGAHDDDSRDEQMIILIMVETTPASGNTAAVYEPVGGSGNAITGVAITIDDDDPPDGM